MKEPFRKKYRILLIEDEPSLVATLTDMLKSQGYSVESRTNGKDGLQVALETSFDLVILDVMLPGMNGFDVCRALRKEEIDTPILMLTARSELGNKVSGLRGGADDYMTKPFETEELQARVEALLRRSTRRPDALKSFSLSDGEIDFVRGLVIRGTQRLELSERECQILRFFIEHRGETLSREDLLKEVWGYDSVPLTRTVDVHIVWLRQKIEVDPRSPRHIVTVHGQGYRFVE